MAVDYGGTDIPRKVSADVSSSAYYAGAMANTGLIGIAGAGVLVYGVIQPNDADASGKVARIRIDGTSKCIAGAAFEEGDELMSDSAGKFITATTGNYVAGIATDPAAAAGDIVGMRLATYESN